VDLPPAKHLAAKGVPPQRIARFSGFGLSAWAEGYLFQPTSVEEIAAVFELARRSQRQVTLRGSGLSYGDAALGSECLIIDIRKMRHVLGFDKVTGVLEAEAGITLEAIWRNTLKQGWWLPVVSGTMFPTLGGALAMNIHGKNNFKAGTLGEHVVELDLLTPKGDLLTIRKGEPLLHEVISSAGLLGVITRVKLQLKRVSSGDLKVFAKSVADWDEQFEAFDKYLGNADYAVSWVDCFGRDHGKGRGLFHAAWHKDENEPETLWEDHQDLPSRIFGLFPKREVWRFLRPMNNRSGMKFLNAAKHTSAWLIGDNKMHTQSLVKFSFLLDYVPNWRNAYLPGGFLQYQSFVPAEHARQVFAQQVEMQQERKLEAYLGVMKRHRPDDFLFSHSVDGYSLALDFKVTEDNLIDLAALCHEMNDLVLSAGGRFYFAKDSTLRPADVRAYLGEATLSRFRELKSRFDPDGLLTSELARRLRLMEA
jgi:decaprenylphospho-beta-D-ribofuranose 2-oxidase